MAYAIGSKAASVGGPAFVIVMRKSLIVAMHSILKNDGLTTCAKKVENTPADGDTNKGTRYCG